jgi:alpha-D-ribose 1-methylphosphonate 5-triphosphate synthase subunit PhnH
MQSEILYDEIFDAQEHFRLILDSMARPGKINVIPDLDIRMVDGINKASALIGFSLLNTDASFCAIGELSYEIEECISLHTAAKIESLQKADFVFVKGSQSSDFIADLKTGTLPYPEDSATIVLDVLNISADETADSLQLNLKGPGIKTIETVYVTGLNDAILDAVKEQNFEFPLGIDLILTDTENRMICIPRSNDFTYELAENTNQPNYK